MSKFKNYTGNRQQGAVSLFVVVFSALLVTIVTISFIQIMLRNQQEATTADLSQSAYDSALAGVEDAKRALVAGPIANSNSCDSVAVALGIPIVPNKGAVIRQDAGDTSSTALEQAYTCVKVDQQPSKISKQLIDGQSTLIPLTTLNKEPFDKIEISWKLDSNTTPTINTDGKLPRQSTWSPTQPAMIRAQLMQFGANFSLSEFDSNPSTGAPSSNAATMFMYPSRIGIDTAFSNDAEPTPAMCVIGDEYTCKITLSLADPIGGNSSNRQAFLRLTSLYNASSIKIVVKNTAGTELQFSGVQAVVDSTGRAGNLFRRVSASVDLYPTAFPYPEAALDLDGDLCKKFRVTDTDYDAGAAPVCQP